MPGELRNLLQPTTESESTLRRLLGSNFNTSARYRVASTRSLPRRTEEGWVPCGISEGDLHLMTKPRD